MSAYRFEVSHTTETVGLTLFDRNTNVVWHGDLERYKAQEFVDALYRGYTNSVIFVKDYNIAVINEGTGATVLIGDDSPYLKYKVLLNPIQTKELASTMQMHIIASEQDGRPRDLTTPMDDTLNTGWSPEDEKRKYGSNDLDDRDDADWWKKGNKK